MIIGQSYNEWRRWSAVGTNNTVTFILCLRSQGHACRGGVLSQVLQDELGLGSSEELSGRGSSKIRNLESRDHVGSRTKSSLVWPKCRDGKNDDREANGPEWGNNGGGLVTTSDSNQEGEKTVGLEEKG